VVECHSGQAFLLTYGEPHFGCDPPITDELGMKMQETIDAYQLFIESEECTNEADK